MAMEVEVVGMIVVVSCLDNFGEVVVVVAVGGGGGGGGGGVVVGGGGASVVWLLLLSLLRLCFNILVLYFS